MTPEMVKRVEFLREKAAEGYGSRWLAGELGLSARRISKICRENGIMLRNWQPTNVVQAASRKKINPSSTYFERLVDINECEDFLPDVGEV